MKRTLFHLSIIILCIQITACNFVDIDTPGVINHKKMFQNEQGFNEVLTGVYALIASNKLYGKELSYGFIDEIAQLYYNDHEPNETPLTHTYDLQYRNNAVQIRINSIWENAYTAISALNSMITEARKRNSPYIKHLEGEALILRAMLHFDLLRLFAPHISQPNALAIPYVKTFSIEPQARLSVVETYQNIIADLQEGERILATDTNTINRSPRFLYVNHDVAMSLLARVFLWGGNKSEALIWAQKVVASNYQLAKEEAILQLFMGYNARSECIFALHTPKMYLDVRNTCYPARSTSTFNMVRNNYKTIFKTNTFTISNNDYRFQAYFTLTNWGHPVVTLTKLYDKNYDETSQWMEGRIPCINLIRLPEIYYIIAEASYDTDRQKSIDALNTVISSRGLHPLSINDIASYTTFKNILINEITKEFWGEGQIFFTHKRLNMPLEGLHGKIHPANNNTFVLPLPNSEQPIS